MRFYVIEHAGGAIGCELTKREALAFAAERGYSRDEVEIEALEVEVSAETIRRLLGNLGGFAKE